MAEAYDELDNQLDGDMVDSDVEAALERQDAALALLERLRLAERPSGRTSDVSGGGRREGRRWPPPEGVRLELHDGVQWHEADCVDMGIGGGRVRHLPEWAQGPTPVRLSAGPPRGVLALGDIMWHDSHSEVSGVRFEFVDAEDHDAWAGLLIDALLASYAV